MIRIDDKFIPSNPNELANFDLKMEDLRDLINNPRFKSLLDIIEESSSSLIESGSRVGSMIVSITPDGNLQFRFISRYSVTIKGLGII